MKNPQNARAVTTLLNALKSQLEAYADDDSIIEPHVHMDTGSGETILVPRQPRSSLERAIFMMNRMYQLPAHSVPYLDIAQAATRLSNFQRIIKDEIDELEDVYDDIVDAQLVLRTATENGDISQKATNEEKDKAMRTTPEYQKAMVSFADVLADVVVFCFSEAAKVGIPLSDVLHLVMGANFTKLGADGKPILDEHGKFQKGPHTLKPEPAIQQLLFPEV